MTVTRDPGDGEGEGVSSICNGILQIIPYAATVGMYQHIHSPGGDAFAAWLSSDVGRTCFGSVVR